MIQLPNGCYCGSLTVNPRNWKQTCASIKKDWYIKYRFYDPKFKNNQPDGKQRIAKGNVNRFKNYSERRKAMEELIKTEMELLNEGLNPNYKKGSNVIPDEISYEIKPTTPFIKALYAALEKLKTQDKPSVKSCLKFVSKAAEQLRFNFLDIQLVELRHIYLVLEQCEKNSKRWSAQTYNHYRAYLMMLFKILRKLQAIKSNPVLEIEKAQVTRKIRVTLSDKQRAEIDNHLLKNDPDFRRYVHIFFTSGSRIAELARLQGKDVDLSNQRFKVTVLKGKSAAHEEWRPIRNVSLEFWDQAMENCGVEDFVFSRGVRPNKKPVLPEYITKRWRKRIKADKVKGGLGINVDFYALKHLNLDETAAIISEQQEGIKAAAAAAGHTTPVITMKYAQGEKERQNERLKKLENKFA